MGESSRPQTEAPAHGSPDPGSAVILLLSTFPDRQLAAAAARRWVEAGLAACVHIAAAGHSVYRWNGVVETSDEVALTAKTTTSHVEALQEALRRDHPYELPEVLLVSPEGGSDAYLDWVRDTCRSAPEAGRAIPGASAG